MAVKLRLMRMGSKKRPFYRVVAADVRSPRDGRFIEIVGTYNPLNGQVEIKEDRVMEWLKTGAKPTQTTRDVFSKLGIMEKYHNHKLGKEISVEEKISGQIGKEIKDKKEHISKINGPKATPRVYKSEENNNNEGVSDESPEQN